MKDDSGERGGTTSRPAVSGGASLSEAFQKVFEERPISEEHPAARLPDAASVREGRHVVHEGLHLPVVEARSSDEAVEVYVRLSAARKPPSTDILFIIGTDISPHPQGGMTFVNVDSAQFVVDSKRNEDGYKFISRLAAAVTDAGFNVSLERASTMVSGPTIARLRIRRP
jgi:hypothetical protein